MMRWAISIGCCVVLWLLPALGRSGAAEVTPESPVPPYRLVRVTLDGTGFVWVLPRGDDELPDVDNSQPGKCVWTGPPGKYWVIGVDGEPQRQFQFEVEILTAGPGPGPDPPGPDPPGPDPPGPDPPIPDEVPNQMGVGKVAYQEAAKLQQKTEATALGDLYVAVAVDVHNAKITVAQAQAKLKESREKLGPEWDVWDEPVEEAIRASVKKYGQTVYVWKSCYREIGVALREAGK